MPGRNIGDKLSNVTVVFVVGTGASTGGYGGGNMGGYGSGGAGGRRY